ncbi:MAG: squalene synthase HpnC [Thermoguttaceae bacterium]
MFADDLKRYGPEAASAHVPTLDESRRHCRRLAARHYENFTVVSRLLLPRLLWQHVANIYAYCRWADDLADETGDPQQALALLAWWETQLTECYAGRAVHPVFVALRETIAQFQIPADPFRDLLDAFRQDQRVTRYETSDDVLDYCRRSANPVGRLVLHLGRCHTEDRTPLADAICTGLQLANFCQDVANDLDRGRIYLPRTACRRFGYGDDHFRRRQCNEAFRQLLAAQVDEAEIWLRAGTPLAAMMPKGLRLPVALFAAGGMAILQAIRRQRYDVWSKRPTVSKLCKLRLAAGCWWRLPAGHASSSCPA